MENEIIKYVEYFTHDNKITFVILFLKVKNFFSVSHSNGWDLTKVA